MSGFLLDTHALLWWVHQPNLLSDRAHDLLLDGRSEIFASPVSAMEIATKNRLGKMPFESELVRQFAEQVDQEGFVHLPITAVHAQLAGGFPQPHRDPWDRLLAAQGQLERLTLITCDEKLNGFGVKTLW